MNSHDLSDKRIFIFLALGAVFGAVIGAVVKWFINHPSTIVIAAGIGGGIGILLSFFVK